MEMPAHRTWMYYNLIAGQRGYTAEFFQGVKEFLDFACQQPKYLNEGVIKCPCKLCKNKRHLTPNEVNAHIRQKGFTPGYWYWTSHGEKVPQINIDVDMHSDSVPYGTQQDTGFDDAALSDQNFVQNEEASPNVEATEFYDMLNSTQQPLRSGYKNTSKFSAIAMLGLKYKHNMSQDCFNDLMKVMRELSHVENEIPSNSRETKRTLHPTKILRKKKCAQTHAPLIIPSVTPEAYCNQATQPPTHTKFIRPQPTKPQSQLSQPRLQPQPSQPRPRPQHTSPQSRPQPLQNISQTMPTQALELQEFPMVNRTPSSSSCHASDDSNGNKISILPEGDGFDQHELVVKEIASIIRTNLKEGKPSWKQLSKEQRDSWFDIFKSKFTWSPQHKDMVRRNFEKRGSAKMIQLMQEARKSLDEKPIWMEECVWAQLKAHWESLEYKRMSETNKRNCESMAGASLHTGGSIPHRLHWKRMKEAKGTDPSLAEFYFRTHRKKDQSWVVPCAESSYDKFEQRKLESSSKFVSEENGGDNQRSTKIPSDLDIWIDSVGKKKGRVFGLGSQNKTLVTSVKLPITTKDVIALRSQIHALNESLHKQEQEKIEMKQELTETRKQVAALMQHLGFAGSSS